MANLKLFCNNPNLTSLRAFADYYKLRVVDKKDKNGNGFTVDEFFEYNRDTIFNQLDTTFLQRLAKQKKKKLTDLTSKDIDKDITLPCPSYLYIDQKYVNYSAVVKNTNFQVQEVDTIAFEDEQIRSILDDETTQFKTYAIKRSVPGCRVIGFFKSLYYSGKKNDGKGHGVDNVYDSTQNFVDISKFIITLNTSVGANGGQFSISLPHIPVYATQAARNVDYLTDILANGINYNEFIDKTQGEAFKVGKNREQTSVRAETNAVDYFEWLIQPNDLLFISFNDMDDLTDDNLAGHVFDMICLIDNVSITRNAQAAVSVDISGRDLMKLLTDDASIFYPAGVSNGNKYIFDNTETVLRGGDKDSIIRGVKANERQGDGATRQITGFLNIFASEPNDFSIDFVLKTVVSHLANFQIVPDDLFINWGDRRTTFSMFKPKNT
jgi:hypothetical protein